MLRDEVQDSWTPAARPTQGFELTPRWAAGSGKPLARAAAPAGRPRRDLGPLESPCPAALEPVRPGHQRRDACGRGPASSFRGTTTWRMRTRPASRTCPAARDRGRTRAGDRSGAGPDFGAYPWPVAGRLSYRAIEYLNGVVFEEMGISAPPAPDAASAPRSPTRCPPGTIWRCSTRAGAGIPGTSRGARTPRGRVGFRPPRRRREGYDGLQEERDGRASFPRRGPLAGGVPSGVA